MFSFSLQIAENTTFTNTTETLVSEPNNSLEKFTSTESSEIYYDIWHRQLRVWLSQLGHWLLRSHIDRERFKIIVSKNLN